MIVREGYLNPGSGCYFSREIDDDNEKVRYICKRRSNESPGMKLKIIEKLKDDSKLAFKYPENNDL